MKAIVKYSVLFLIFVAASSSFAGYTEEVHSFDLTEHPFNSGSESSNGIFCENQFKNRLNELFYYN